MRLAIYVVRSAIVAIAAVAGWIVVVVWGLGDDEMALVGNLNDFSQDEFIAVAESVTVPSGR